MITNLFSIFDPSLYILNVYPWVFVFIVFILFLNNKFILKNKLELRSFLIIYPLIKELKPLLSINVKKGNLIFLLILFLSIFIVNFMALFPFIFTVTGHIIITFSLSLIIWLSFIIFGWINNSNNIIAHLVPIGTPLALINFIVLIEIISNIIRPITLSVRLCANIVAGHLLLRLLRNFALINVFNFSFSLAGLLILGILEVAVALIQSYVFITLITLYSTEIHYEQ